MYYFLHHAVTEVVERANGSDPQRPSKVEFANRQTHILCVERALRLADLCLAKSFKYNFKIFVLSCSFIGSFLECGLDQASGTGSLPFLPS